MLYGHPRMYALKSGEGFLCHSWWSDDNIGLILFVDAKSAATWVKEVSKLGKKHNQQEWIVIAQVTAIDIHPKHLMPTINPSGEFADVRRMMSRRLWVNW